MTPAWHKNHAIDLFSYEAVFLEAHDDFHLTINGKLIIFCGKHCVQLSYLSSSLYLRYTFLSWWSSSSLAIALDEAFLAICIGVASSLTPAVERNQVERSYEYYLPTFIFRSIVDLKYPRKKELLLLIIFRSSLKEFRFNFLGLRLCPFFIFIPENENLISSI